MNHILHSNPTDELKWVEFPFIFLFLAGVCFFVHGVILWITVGAVVANPPYGSKCFQIRSVFTRQTHSLTCIIPTMHAVTVTVDCQPDCIQTKNTSMYTTLNRCTTSLVLLTT